MIFGRRRTARIEELFSQELDGIVTGQVPDDLLRTAETLRSAAASIPASAAVEARRSAVLDRAAGSVRSVPRPLRAALLAASLALGSTVGIVGASLTTSWLGVGPSPAGGPPAPASRPALPSPSAAPDLADGTSTPEPSSTPARTPRPMSSPGVETERVEPREEPDDGAVGGDDALEPHASDEPDDDPEPDDDAEEPDDDAEELDEHAEPDAELED